MKKIIIAGVTHLSDLYPNVRYKHQMLLEMDGFESSSMIYNLGSGSNYAGLGKGRAGKLLHMLSTFTGTCFIFLRLLVTRSDYVYILYPAPVLAWLLSLLPIQRQRRIVLDAFISLYDTAVIDRKLFARKSLLARLLFRMEARAFSFAHCVLVDTQQNASYLAELFKLPPEKFQSLPLSIPAMPPRGDVGKAKQSFGLHCLFIGSLVPLHGIERILNLAGSCSSALPGFSLEIIGDGQDAEKIEQFMSDHKLANLTWHRGFMSTQDLVARIQQADLCFGIFGAGDKTRRVLPYKIYYYCALGKPFLTLETPCLKDFCQQDSGLFLCSMDEDDESSLLKKVSFYYDNPRKLAEAGQIAGNLYSSKLAPDVIKPALMKIFQSL